MKAHYDFDQTVVIADSAGRHEFQVHHRYFHSAPLPYGDRLDNYLAQNGSFRPLTVRQHRALRKADKRAAAHRERLITGQAVA